MRFEQIIAAVTRTLVIRTVREMEAVRLFVRTVSFHLCNARMSQSMSQSMSLGMSALMRQMRVDSAHAGALSWPSSLADMASRIDSGCADSKRSNLLYQPALVLANCPANGRARFAKV